MERIGRNDPCHCGSGKKYKKCCLANDDTQRASFPKELSLDQKKELIRNSWEYPLDRCLINGNWREVGLARIVVMRRQDTGHYILGVYLVDTYCLGVKSAFCNAGVSQDQIEYLLEKQYPDDEPEELSLGGIQNIVEGAIKYAEKLGFYPDPDFELAGYVLGEKEEACGQGDFHFGGPQGKPLYVAGPYDDQDAIIQKLKKQLGDGGFDFMVPLGGDF